MKDLNERPEKYMTWYFAENVIDQNIDWKQKILLDTYFSYSPFLENDENDFALYLNVGNISQDIEGEISYR